MLTPKSITEMERCEIKNSIYHFFYKKGSVIYADFTLIV